MARVWRVGRVIKRVEKKKKKRRIKGEIRRYPYYLSGGVFSFSFTLLL